MIATLRELLARGDDQRRCERARLRVASSSPVVSVDALQAIDERERVVLGVGALGPVRIGHRFEQLRKARPAKPRRRREVRAEKIRSTIR
jgi:hypothetical protein